MNIADGVNPAAEMARLKLQPFDPTEIDFGCPS